MRQDALEHQKELRNFAQVQRAIVIICAAGLRCCTDHSQEKQRLEVELAAHARAQAQAEAQARNAEAASAALRAEIEQLWAELHAANPQARVPGQQNSEVRG